jgi:F-type H+-transporting ATPase subunit beta
MNPHMIQFGTQLFGRVVNSRGEPIDGKGPVADTISVPLIDLSQATATPSRANQLFETGIKPFDLLSPLARGGINALFADPGAGLQVNIEEITRSMLAHHAKGAMICLEMDESTYETNELTQIIHEGGLDDNAIVVFEQAGSSGEVALNVVQAGLTIAAHLHALGYEVLLAADQRISETGMLARIDAVRPIAAQQDITIMLQGLLETYHRYQGDGTLGKLDAHAVFNRALFRRRLYPAIEPLQMASRLLDEGIAGQEHVRVAQEVHQLLRRYYELHEIVDTQGESVLSSLPAGDQQVYRRGQRVEYFLTQPYVVAEAYTDIPGEYVRVADTLRGFEQLLAGQYDDLPVQAFWMVGAIDQAAAKGKAMKG